MTRLAAFLLVLTWTSPALGFHEVASFGRTANSGGGAGYYYTGSPRSKGYDCTVCHVAAERRISVELATELGSGRYTPGLIYPINVKLMGEHRGLMSAFNPNTFAAEIVDADGETLGSLSSTLGGVVEIVDDGRVAVAEGFGEGLTEWRFSWAAPATGAPGTLHLAMLDGDGASDPERRFIDPLNDDVVVIALALCPDGQVCEAAGAPDEETSPAGCQASRGGNRTWLVGLLALLCLHGRRRRGWDRAA